MAALVWSQRIYLMDEPLSPRDAKLCADLRIELKPIPMAWARAVAGFNVPSAEGVARLLETLAQG